VSSGFKKSIASNMTSPEPTVLLISSIPELIPLFIVPRVDGLSLLNVPLNVFYH
jgi:hypothetical protein